MDFDELIAALTALEAVSVRVQVGTPDHEHVAVEAVGALHAEAHDRDWSLFCVEGPFVRLHLRRAEFGGAAASPGCSGSLRFVCSGAEFYVVPSDTRA